METPFTKEQLRHFAALTGVAFLSATTLFFANQSRHLSASLKVRKKIINVLVNSSFPETLKKSETLALAKENAQSTKRLVAIGFFEPG